MARPTRECKELRARLAAEPGADHAPSVVAHLAACPGCAQWATDVERIARAAEGIRVESGPRDREVALRLARQARARVQARSGFPWWGWPALSASLSTAAAILVLGLASTGGVSPTVERSRPVPEQSARQAASRAAGGTGNTLSSLESWLLLPRRRTSNVLPADLRQLRRRAVLGASGASGASVRRRP